MKELDEAIIAVSRMILDYDSDVTYEELKGWKDWQSKKWLRDVRKLAKQTLNLKGDDWRIAIIRDRSFINRDDVIYQAGDDDGR